MSSKVTFLLLILIGALFTGVAVFISTTPINLETIMFIAIFGILGVAIFCLGVFKLFQTIINLGKEKRALENGSPSYGIVVKVKTAASTTTNNYKKSYYFITIRFLDEFGEKREYTLAEQFDEPSTAYLVNKDKVSLMVYNKICALNEEVMDEAYEMDDEEIRRIIKRCFKAHATEDLDKKFEEATAKAFHKIADVVEKNETVFKGVNVILYFIFRIVPSLVAIGILTLVAFNAADMITAIVCGVFAVIVLISMISMLMKVKKIRRR